MYPTPCIRKTKPVKHVKPNPRTVKPKPVKPKPVKAVKPVTPVFRPPFPADPALLGFRASRMTLQGIDLREFDVGLRAGMRRFLAAHGHDPGELTDAAIRDVMKPDKDDPLAVAKRRARDGNHNAQFRPGAGLRASGFGVWNHLRGLEAGLAVTEEVARMWGYTHTGGVPHLIAKLPTDTQADFDRGRWRAGTLAPHIDGGSFADAMAACVKYAAHPTFDAWGEEHGEQILAHLQIGTTGHTCTLWHLTPWRYAVVLAAMRLKISDAKWHTTGGPQFYKHDTAQLAAVANRVIAALAASTKTAEVLEGAVHEVPDEETAAVLAHLPPQLHAVPPGQEALPPLVPGPMIDVTAGDQALCAPTVVAWKTMVLHWVTPTGPLPRYTFTVPLQRPATQATLPATLPVSHLVPQAVSHFVPRAVHHLRLLAAWKEAEEPERARLLDQIRADKVPWAGGQVHKFPGVTEADNVGFWEGLVASRARVEAHLADLSLICKPQ
jgi:hypothetical protein